MVTTMNGCWNHRIRLCLLIISVVIYLIFGALVFSALEEHDEAVHIQSLRTIRAEFAAKINGSVPDYQLEEFIAAVVKASEAGILATNNVTFSSSWTFGQSFFFVGTLVTTIGYGHTLPLTLSGKTFAIFYSLFGVPLTLIMFSAVVATLMKPLGALFICLKEKLSHTSRELYVRLLHLSIVVLLLLTLFLFIPAAIFTALETEWSYSDSLYYCFISLTTIGLGDYIPGEDAKQPYRAIYKIAVTIYLFLGVIFLMTTVAVLCNISELNLMRYFVLEETPVEDDEEEQLTPNAQKARRTYTDSETEFKGEIITPNSEK